jgi:hypothetical protein
VGVLMWWVVVSGVACILFFISSICAQKFIVKGESYDLENKHKKGLPSWSRRQTHSYVIWLNSLVCDWKQYGFYILSRNC